MSKVRAIVLFCKKEKSRKFIAVVCSYATMLYFGKWIAPSCSDQLLDNLSMRCTLGELIMIYAVRLSLNHLNITNWQGIIAI